MCTVTYIPAGDQVFLTSNRDEKSWRKAAAPPQVQEYPGGKLYFPRDGDAGGSWITLHENGNALVLLNGAFKAHFSLPPYRKSRGLILVDLSTHAMPFDYFRSINLENIEPFTLVIWQQDALFECRWDGQRKYAKQLDQSLPYIWSSATLYDDEVAARRKRWFDEWIEQRESFTIDEILHFHQFTGDGDPHNDLSMNRDGKVFTVSITSIAISEANAGMAYLDIMANRTYLQSIELHKVWAGR